MSTTHLDDHDRPAAATLLDVPRADDRPAPASVRTRDGVIGWASQVRAPSAVRAHVLTAAYAASGFLGLLVIVGTSPVWRNAAPTWRLQLPVIGYPSTSLQAGLLFALGMVLLCIGWLGMIGRSEHMPGDDRRRRAVVVAVLVLWAVPPLLGTPLLSNDSYSYAAQGEMASRGIDPTAQGPYALSRGPFLRATDPIWRDAPAPYGPVSIELSKQAAARSGHDPATTVWIMRLYALLGVALSAVGVSLLAAQHRLSSATALTVGVLSPLVLVHLLGGSHNDALMMGLLAVGLASFGAGRKVLGVLLLTLAVGVKLPAVIALGFAGWAWFGPEARFWRRVASSAAVAAAAAALLAVLSLLVGIGGGWITALRDTGKVTSTFSATTKLGYVVADVLQGLGLGVGDDAVVGVFRALGLVAAVAIGVVLLVRSPRIGMVRATGLAMTAFVLLGPVVWPWYLPAGLALLAASGLGRYRPSYLVLVVAATFFVWPTSIDPVVVLEDWQHQLGFAVVVGVAAAAWAAQAVSPRMAAWRAERERLRSGLVRPGGAGAEGAVTGDAIRLP